MSHDLSIIIPFFNRPDTVLITLASIQRARGNLDIEIILVDDGSTPAASDQLQGIPHAPDRIIRQSNQGLLFARLAGLAQARGEYVIFLDSDDLVGPDKFRLQIEAMHQHAADVSYTDTRKVRLGATLDDTVTLEDEAPLPATDDSADFFIQVQPAPHSPVFRTAWLRPLVAQPLFAPAADFNPVAEIWFYHIAALHPAKVIKVTGPHTVIGQHGGTRITNQWERMAVASLAVMEAFMRSCPVDAASRRVREMVAAKAFNSWRALPRDFSRDFQQRMLGLWLRQPTAAADRLGGPRFARLARWLGAIPAARLLRFLRGHSYASCRTLADDRQIDLWLSRLPAP